MLMLVAIISLSVVCAALSACVFTLSISHTKLWIELKSIQKSTHQIVMPTAMADVAFEQKTEATEKSVKDAFNDYVGIN